MTYQLKDFQDYQNYILSQGYELSHFVDDINYIIESEHVAKDFIQVLDELHQIKPHFCLQLKTLLRFETNMNIQAETLDFRSCVKNNNNDIEAYMYLKFLLLEPLQKKELFTHTQHIRFFVNMLIPNGERREWNMDYFAEYVYRKMNTDTLTNFMDFFDTNRKLEPLDTSKLENLTHQADEYVSWDMFLNFKNIYKRYQGTQLFYNLVYLLSKNTDAPTGSIDFVQRYHQCIDKFIVMNNFCKSIYMQYYIDENKNEVVDAEILQNIPTDRQLTYEAYRVNLGDYYDSDEYYDSDDFEDDDAKNPHRIYIYKTFDEKEKDVRLFIRNIIELLSTNELLVCLEKVFGFTISSEKMQEQDVPLDSFQTKDFERMQITSIVKIVQEFERKNRLDFVSQNTNDRNIIKDVVDIQNTYAKRLRRIKTLCENYTTEQKNYDLEFKLFLQNLSEKPY